MIDDTVPSWLNAMPAHEFGILDYSVMLVYFVAMLVIGIRAGSHKKDAGEYFLAHRQIPWYAIGLSIVATLISSLSYISEPGEVFLSGFTNITGKFIAIILETGFVVSGSLPPMNILVTGLTCPPGDSVLFSSPSRRSHGWVL